jgi:hypothetical protein
MVKVMFSSSARCCSEECTKHKASTTRPAGIKTWPQDHVKNDPFKTFLFSLSARAAKSRVPPIYSVFGSRFACQLSKFLKMKTFCLKHTGYWTVYVSFDMATLIRMGWPVVYRGRFVPLKTGKTYPSLLGVCSLTLPAFVTLTGEQGGHIYINVRTKYNAFWQLDLDAWINFVLLSFLWWSVSTSLIMKYTIWTLVNPDSQTGRAKEGRTRYTKPSLLVYIFSSGQTECPTWSIHHEQPNPVKSAAPRVLLCRE